MASVLQYDALSSTHDWNDLQHQVIANVQQRNTILKEFVTSDVFVYEMRAKQLSQG